MTKTKKNKKSRKHFTDVDVWQKSFGPISVRAVYDCFAQRFGIETKDMKNYSFTHCVNALRKLENSDYIKPKDQSIDNKK